MTQLPQRILTKNKEGQLLGLGTWQKLQGASLILPVLPFSVAKRIMLYAKAHRSKQELVGPAMSVYIEGAGQGIEQAGNHYTLSFPCPIFGTGFPKNSIFF